MVERYVGVVMDDGELTETELGVIAPTKDVPGPAAQRPISAAERSAAVREAAQPAAVGAVTCADELWCDGCEAPLRPQRWPEAELVTGDVATVWGASTYCAYCVHKLVHTSEGKLADTAPPVEDEEPEECAWAGPGFEWP